MKNFYKIILLIFFLIKSSFVNAENVDVFKPESHFFLYFIVSSFFISITFYFYTKTKYIEKNKKNFFYSLIFLFTLVFSFFIDSNFQKSQILSTKNELKTGETSIKTKFNIEKIRRQKLQEKLENQNIKLKLLEEKIKNSKNYKVDNFTTQENILKSNEIQRNIKKLENDLYNIDKSIEDINSGNFKGDLVKEYTVSQKLKNRKKLKQQELENIKSNYGKTNFSEDIGNDDVFLSGEEQLAYQAELLDYKKELEKSNRKIILVKGEKELEKKVEKKYSMEEIFLRKHYEYISKKEFKKAYEESSKKIDFKKYISWYKNTSKIIVNKIYKKKNTNNFYYVDLDIYDNSGVNNYLVLKELVKKTNNNFVIKTSKTIEIKKINKKNIKKNIFGIMTNKELKNILISKNKKYLILDAREDVERKTGYISGSIFFRFADLEAGDYKKLDKNKIIIIYTWEKTKEIEVAKFLASKGFKVKILENGVSGWLTFNGPWIGKKNVFEKYKNPKYKNKFSKILLEEEFKKGIYLIDVRKKKIFEKSHLKGSINLPLTYLPKNKWSEYIKKIPKDVKVATICDNNITCFYAQVVGIEMQKVGYTFMGYYNLNDK